MHLPRAFAVLFLTRAALAATSPATPLAADLAAAAPLVRQTYEAIHRHPELGLHETATADLLRARLREIGFTRFETIPALPTAVVAVLDTGRPGPVTALRSEMDARPTREAPGHDPRSEIDGVMHNCGHDAHAAMLLGAARVLHARQVDLSGRIVFLFQPAEEVKGGADDVVADGILDRLGVTAVFAQHVYPGLPAGRVSLTPGPALAGSNYFKLTLRGRGSHAATPEAGSNLPLVASRAADALATLAARRLAPAGRTAVISVTHIETGRSDALNVLPAEALLEGTIRAYESVDTPPAPGQPAITELIQTELTALETAAGVTGEWTLRKASPPTLNDRALQSEILPRVQSAWPGVITADGHPGMFSEDFAYYTEKFPCLYFGLGIAEGELGQAGVHTADFTIAPAALPVGTRLLVELALARHHR